MTELLQTTNTSDNFKRGTDANNILTGTIGLISDRESVSAASSSSKSKETVPRPTKESGHHHRHHHHRYRPYPGAAFRHARAE